MEKYEKRVNGRMVMSYNVDGNLTECLHLAMELENETGMAPRGILDEKTGMEIAYVMHDAKCVINGVMSEKAYIDKNKLNN